MRERVDIEKGAALEGAVGRSGAETALLEREEHLRLQDFGEIDKGGAVEEPGSFSGVAEVVVSSAGAGVAAVFFEHERVDGIIGAAGLVDGAGEQLREK